MAVVIRVTSGPHSGQEYSGRPPGDVRGRPVVARAVPDAGRQAPVARAFPDRDQPPVCHLIDLGSTNGTKVNGLRVERVQLRDGDVITAGDSCVRDPFQRDVRRRRLPTATCSGCGKRIPIDDEPDDGLAPRLARDELGPTSGSATSARPAA